MRVNTFLWWPNQGMIALATGQPCPKPGRLQHSFFFCFTSVYLDPSILAQNQDHTKLQGRKNANMTRSPLEILTDIAGRGSRCPDSTDLSLLHRAVLITEHRVRAYASPFSPFVKGFACFSLLNKLTEDYSVVLAGRELSPLWLPWPLLHSVNLHAVQDKGHILPTEPWRQGVPGEEILEVRKKNDLSGGGEKYLRHIKPSTETPLKREENLNWIAFQSITSTTQLHMSEC